MYIPAPSILAVLLVIILSPIKFKSSLLKIPPPLLDEIQSFTSVVNNFKMPFDNIHPPSPVTSPNSTLIRTKSNLALLATSNILYNNLLDLYILYLFPTGDLIIIFEEIIGKPF